MIKVKSGDIITVNEKMIDSNGKMIFRKGHKVMVEKLIMKSDEVIGVKLNETEGIYFPNLFRELK
jgi:hypothetical protein